MDQGSREDSQTSQQSGTVSKSYSDEHGERRRGPVSPNWTYDDYPLTPVESRLVQRIERRGADCYDSVASLAEDFFTSQQSIRSASATLEGIGAITIEYAKGPYGTNIYKLNPLETWLYFSHLKARLAAISSTSNFTEKRQLRNEVRVEIRGQIETAAAKVKAKRKAEQDEKKKQHTPVKIDRGQELENNPGLSKSTGDALQNQQPAPAKSGRESLSKTTDKGFPSEGFPSEDNQQKVIPHTQRRAAPAEGGRSEADDSDSLRSSGASLRSDAVCVSTHSDFLETETEEEARFWIRPLPEGFSGDDSENSNPWDNDPFTPEQVEDYVLWSRDHLGENIYNPTGLVKQILRDRDPFVYDKIENVLMDMDIDRQQRLAAEKQRLQREREQEKLNRERETERQRTEEELRSQQAEEEARRNEEWERNAPHREAARLEKRRQETLGRFEQAKQLARHSATNPNLYAGMIKNVLAGDDEATRLFDEWIADEKNSRAAGAA